MVNRRFAQLHTSDDEDNSPPPSPPPPPRKSTPDETRTLRKRKKVYLPDDDEDDKEDELKLSELNKKKKNKIEEPEPPSENDEQDEVEALPLGDPIRTTGKGRGKKVFYGSFEYDGAQYELEDPVLLSPEEGGQKPYVAIIKDIFVNQNNLKVTGQWFYRPEEADKRGGGNWQSQDTRQLFYSFHRDDVPAESVMHKCVVHFIPLNKQIPRRQQHPGFIVQKVYDTEQRRLFKLTDKDYEDNKQQEIDVLVHKTLDRLGDIPDLEPGDANMEQEDPVKNKRLLRKRNVSPLDVTREDEGLGRSQSFKAETPGSTVASEYYVILSNFKVLTKETQRDKWMEKLLQSIQFMCSPPGGKQNDEEEQGGSKKSVSNQRNGSPNKGHASFDWPDAAVPAVAALEKAAHDSLSSDFGKYNQKMRSLMFNLKNNEVLTRRFLNRELEPAQILNMSPNELKEGLTSEEIAAKEPEDSGRIQMTDYRCKICNEKEVGLLEIIQTGHGDRYQLECSRCGHNWYSSRDDAAALTIEGPSNKAVGTAPMATAKFDDLEKNLVSPRGADKGANDPIKKTTDAHVPVLDNQKSFNKTKADENFPTTTKA
ncbi:hypothetical protein ACS0TY_004331 [Phlomoides rotata]